MNKTIYSLLKARTAKKKLKSCQEESVNPDREDYDEEELKKNKGGKKKKVMRF
jgi:hypothetical protein